jgi:hypothetical protein
MNRWWLLVFGLLASPVHAQLETGFEPTYIVGLVDTAARAMIIPGKSSTSDIWCSENAMPASENAARRNTNGRLSSPDMFSPKNSVLENWRGRKLIAHFSSGKFASLRTSPIWSAKNSASESLAGYDKSIEPVPSLNMFNNASFWAGDSSRHLPACSIRDDRSVASAACCFAIAVSFSSCLPCVVSSAMRSFAFVTSSLEASLNLSQCASLTFAIQMIATEAITPTVRLPIKNMFAISATREATSSDGQTILLPPLIPILAMLVVLIVGGAAIVVLILSYRRRYE